MSEKGIGKVPGCSSIEIDFMVYEFVVTSRSDKGGFEEILAMLDDMKQEIEGSWISCRDRHGLTFWPLRTPF